ncbi:hypothetical protein A0H76_1019 [Hepatospora eriocheir]|uniref:Uncharacterized protein n=1 Tax=Hepatospora eriocheir TaxID=1081669 RepID=A0A1X0Q693_9MICR|nr:hypothetical protein A0H76_1019 [Hepatospora eriocheir]
MVAALFIIENFLNLVLIGSVYSIFNSFRLNLQLMISKLYFFFASIVRVSEKSFSKVIIFKKKSE